MWRISTRHGRSSTARRRRDRGRGVIVTAAAASELIPGTEPSGTELFLTPNFTRYGVFARLPRERWLPAPDRDRRSANVLRRREIARSSGITQVEAQSNTAWKCPSLSHPSPHGRAAALLSSVFQ